MARFIDEEKFINTNALKFQEKLTSQYTKFLEEKPWFVTYFTINSVNSTWDNGFMDIEQVLGNRSPIRFNRIDNLPVYGGETLQPYLEDGEDGLDISLESELITLPNTIVPKPNDFFIVNHISELMVFMVTEVRYDTIKSNGFYKFTFSVKSLSKEKIEQLNDQTIDNFSCVYKNIGTEDKCLIRNDDYEVLKNIDNKINELIKMYFILFFDKETNSLIFKDRYHTFYDKYITHFLMNNTILQDSRDYTTLYLLNEDSNHLFPIEYEKSIYRFIERRNINIPEQIPFTLQDIQNVESVFKFYRMIHIKSINLGITYLESQSHYWHPTLIQCIKNNSTLIRVPDSVDNMQTKEVSIIWKMIIKYFNTENSYLFKDEISHINQDIIQYSFESYLLIPVVIFILRKTYRDFISN